ncbi:MAG: hypothetical protein ACLVAU_13605 [Ruminococcus sp.]
MTVLIRLFGVCEKDIFKDEILKYAVFTENEIDSVKNDLSQAEIETMKRRADIGQHCQRTYQ